MVLFFFFSGGTGFIMNSLIQQMFIVIYDVPDPVLGGGKKQTKVSTWTELHLSGHLQAINNYTNGRIYAKGMCALDKNKVQKEQNKECSHVRFDQGWPQEQIAFDWRSKGGQGVNVRKRTFQAEVAAGAKALKWERHVWRTARGHHGWGGVRDKTWSFWLCFVYIRCPENFHWRA